MFCCFSSPFKISGSYAASTPLHGRIHKRAKSTGEEFEKWQDMEKLKWEERSFQTILDNYIKTLSPGGRSRKKEFEAETGVPKSPTMFPF